MHFWIAPMLVPRRKRAALSSLSGLCLAEKQFWRFEQLLVIWKLSAQYLLSPTHQPYLQTKPRVKVYESSRCFIEQVSAVTATLTVETIPSVQVANKRRKYNSQLQLKSDKGDREQNWPGSDTVRSKGSGVVLHKASVWHLPVAVLYTEGIGTFT